MNSFLNKTVHRANRFLVRLLQKAALKLQKSAFGSLPESEQYQRLLTMPIGELPQLVTEDTWGTDTYRRLFLLLEEYGVHVTANHFYSPIPDTRTLRESKLWDAVSGLPGIDLNLETQLHLLRQVFPTFQAEYDAFPQQKTDDLPPYEFHYFNGWYDFMDALVYYCLIRHYQPATVLEVGSGWSTRIAAKAALKNGNTQVISIEPYPPEVLKQGFPGLNSLIIKKVEQVDPSIFQQLGDGDILFIDTSHVVKTGNDVNYLYLEVLPRLKIGVLVHIHDIFMPEEYPKWWLTDKLLFWNEQYLLQAFMMFNASFKVLFANNYMRLNHLKDLQRTFPKCPSFQNGQSFWIQRVQ